MKKLIVANWKMNPQSAKEAKELFAAIKKGLPKTANAKVVICPPFVYLPLLSGIALGAQNVFYKEQGAFTGEVSPLMLKDLGVNYAIIGHSEAKKYLGETNEVINKKLAEVLLTHLEPILCLGETLEEKKVGKQKEVIEMQLQQALAGILAKDIKNLVIAYEPVWAIGTGNSCPPDQAMSAALLIKKTLTNLYNRSLADAVKILYGGSVTSATSKKYLDHGFDGLLVGGASLDAKEFLAIIASA